MKRFIFALVFISGLCACGKAPDNVTPSSLQTALALPDSQPTQDTPSETCASRQMTSILTSDCIVNHPLTAKTLAQASNTCQMATQSLCTYDQMHSADMLGRLEYDINGSTTATYWIQGYANSPLYPQIANAMVFSSHANPMFEKLNATDIHQFYCCVSL